MKTGKCSLTVMVEAIAGKEIRGSWMADPSVHTVYEVLAPLVSTTGVFDLPLVQGKSVLTFRHLGPAIQRIASDLGRRAAVRETLPELAAWLLTEVERKRVIDMEDLSAPARESRKARRLLERMLLVTSELVHTVRGYHTAVVRPWEDSPLAKASKQAAEHLTLQSAQEELLEACLHSAVLAPEREVRGWLPFAPVALRAMEHSGKLARLRADKVWFTLSTTLQACGASS
jgi:hypothetical protein